jgi:hypothetical protein
MTISMTPAGWLKSIVCAAWSRIAVVSRASASM